MNKILLICLTISFILTPAFTQQKSDTTKITRDNYYSFYLPFGPNVTNDRLSREEISDFIYKSLKEKGYRVLKNILYKLDSNTFISLQGYDFFNKIGYYIFSGQGIRENTRNETIVNIEYAVNDSILDVIKTDSLPKNIIVFNEDWYRYQEDKSYNNSDVVTYEKIIEILRSDIDHYFKDIK